jgi:tetratricopeptide (TPR) repeat protein
LEEAALPDILLEPRRDGRLWRQAAEHGQSGRWSEAAYCYREALREAPQDVAAATGLSTALLQLGRADQAIAALEPILAQADAAAWTAYGRALDLASRFADAISAFERALALDPANQLALVSLGAVLAKLGRREELTARLEAAVAADPQTPALHVLLGAQHYAFGRLDQAVAAMDAALARAPDDANTHALLADMKRYAPGDAQMAAMEALLVRQTLTAEERCLLRYALGKAYADLGRHEESFAHQLEANRIRRGMIAYDFASTDAQFERVKRVFTPELMARLRDAGDPSERPVFVLGVMRSGTTLVEQILSSHPAIAGVGEIPDFRLAVGQALKGFPEPVRTASPEAVKRAGELYLAMTDAAAGDARRVIDKTLNNDVFAGVAHLALPRARFIHVVRDPVDTCLSVFATNLGNGYPFTNELRELGRYYRAQREMMAYWKTLLPAEVFLEVRYENVVADLEGEARRMLAFLGLDFDSACLDFTGTQRPVVTASAAQVRRPLYASSVGRWRPAPEQLKPLLEGLGPYAPAET